MTTPLFSTTRRHCLAGVTAFAARLAVVGGAVALTPTATAQNYVDQNACEGVKKISLVLDYSGSMSGQPLSDQAAAVRSMVQGLPKGVEVQVIAFGTVSEEIGTFTTGGADQDKVLRDVDAQPTLGGTEWATGLNRVADDTGVVMLSSDGTPGDEEEAAVVAKTLRDRGAIITGLFIGDGLERRPGAYSITPDNPGPYTDVITPKTDGVETMFVTSGTGDWAATYGKVVEAACKLAAEPTPEPTPEPPPAPVTVTETPAPMIQEVVVTETVTETPEPVVREVSSTETVTETPEPVVHEVVTTETVTEVPEPVSTTVTETPTPEPVEKPVERVQLATTGAATGLIALSGVTVAGTTLAAKTAAGRRKKDEAA